MQLMRYTLTIEDEQTQNFEKLLEKKENDKLDWRKKRQTLSLLSKKQLSRPPTKLPKKKAFQPVLRTGNSYSYQRSRREKRLPTTVCQLDLFGID